MKGQHEAPKEEKPTSELRSNIASLFKVKTIATLMVMYVFMHLSLSGAISSDNVMNVVVAVVAFYYGTQHESNKRGGGL